MECGTLWYETWTIKSMTKIGWKLIRCGAQENVKDPLNRKGRKSEELDKKK